ncbi:MAG: SWIM zinc finger domain-containing protein [Alphaproteobacteria bacterium]
MEFQHRYYGATTASSNAHESHFGFAPDTLREPTFFVGEVADHLPFREAMSALHHVVVSDMRFKPKDRTVYFEWLKGHEQQLLAEAMAGQAGIKTRIEELRKEHSEISKKTNSIMSPFFWARQRYFNWLYNQDRDAWFVLDPVITVHPDEIFFECFSLDESTYGRLSCDHETFKSIGDIAYGTTNIDYSYTLYDEFQKIRSYRTTSLAIEPSGFQVQTSGEEMYREEKIDLPDSWVRGFLQVSSAMALPAHVVDLHPVDVHNILARLAARKERHGPRSLRFLLEPGAPVRVLIEPWNEMLTFRRSIYQGSSGAEIRLWGRRRLAILARALPLAKSVRLHMLGTGLPSFAVVDYGGLRFTLGMSGWTANDWSRAGQFDLLAPRQPVDDMTKEIVFNALKPRYSATVTELSSATGLNGSTIAAALTAYTQAGRVMYDLDKGVFRLRELSRDPLPMDALRFASEQEEKADRFIAANLVTLGEIGERDGKRVINGTVLDDGKTYNPMIVLDPDERLVEARCDCYFYGHNKMMRGPCEHMLALRRFYNTQTAAITASAREMEVSTKNIGGAV